ncbi:MAG: helix-turn-helix domain-containing protein [Candidatus Micrarchaeia archaeon]
MEPESCPMEKFCKAVGSRWGCIIVEKLIQKKEMSFNELRKLINANPKTLSAKLKHLETQGLVRRRVDAEKKPIRVFYSLTAKGEDIKRVEQFISAWLKAR